MSSMSRNRADLGRGTGSTAAKAAMAVLGIGLVAGATVVIGMDQIMKKIFLNDDWPNEEWSGDDWAEEDLEP